MLRFQHGSRGLGSHLLLPIAAVVSMFATVPGNAASVQSASAFIENRGQMDPAVLYYASGAEGTVYLTRDAVVIDRFRSVAPAGRSDLKPGPETSVVHRVGRTTRMSFENSSGPAQVDPRQASAARYNFIFGRDPSRWTLGVSSFQEVVYRQVWPGIDLVFSAASGRIETRVEAAPGADRSAARFDWEGNDSSGNPVGDPAGAAGDPAGLIGGGQTSGRDDPNDLLWSTFLGGSSEEIAWSVVSDASGNPVVAGVTFSSQFPTTFGAWDRSYAGLGDVFVSKFAADGSSLLWSTFLGGSAPNPDYGYAVTLDGVANPIVTGYTWSEDYPTTGGAYDQIFGGGVDAFVSKLDVTAGTLLWSTFLGGNDYDIGYALDVDSHGNLAVAGRTLSYDYPTTPDSYQPYLIGEEDAFVTLLSAQGNALVWSTLIGGSGFDEASSVELDGTGAPILSGYTASPDYPGASYAGGLYDVVVSKLAPDGRSLLWSRTLGGSEFDVGNGLALDSQGNPFVCGATDSPDFPATDGAYDDSYNENEDAFAASLRGTDGGTIWASYLGGSTPAYETAFALGVDALNRPVVAGSTPSADFPVTAGAYDTGHNGGSDVFLARFSADGSALEWSTFLGGDSDDYGYALILPGTDEAVLAGVAGSPTFPTTDGAYDTSYNGDIGDSFVARLRMNNGGAASAPFEVSSPFGLELRPNPARAMGRVVFSLPTGTVLSLDLFDVHGRRVGNLARGAYGPGEHATAWTGRDERGEPLPAGAYYLRLRTSAGERALGTAVVR